jgi:hypothetical protein
VGKATRFPKQDTSTILSGCAGESLTTISKLHSSFKYMAVTACNTSKRLQHGQTTLVCTFTRHSAPTDGHIFDVHTFVANIGDGFHLRRLA